jgi:transcriptional regulator with XRE-family HTH domain
LKPAELRGIRRRLGLTQAQMAQKLGIAVRSLGRYEAGNRRITRLLAYAVRWLEHLTARR